MGKRMYKVETKQNNNVVRGKIRNNRNAVAASLTNFRSSIFDDKREGRGGAVNSSRDYMDEYEGFEFDCE